MVWFIPSEFAWMIHSRLQIVRTFLLVFHFFTAVSNSIERVEAKRRFTSLWLVHQPLAGLSDLDWFIRLWRIPVQGSADLALILCNQDL